MSVRIFGVVYECFVIEELIINYVMFGYLVLVGLKLKNVNGILKLIMRCKIMSSIGCVGG